MSKPFFLFLFILCYSMISHAQQLGDYYISIPTDITSHDRLKFLTDSTVEISSMPRHLSAAVESVGKYTSTDTSIQIYFDSAIRNPEPFGLTIQPSYNTSRILKKIDGIFIDYERSLIYAREKDYVDPRLNYVIDGKFFLQDVGQMDSSGVTTKIPKANKSLERKLSKFNQANCTTEIVRGLNAYQRYGIRAIPLVAVITSK